MSQRRILLVSADPCGDGKRIKSTLGAEYDVTMTGTGSDAQTEVDRDHYDVIMTEACLPDMKGSDLLKQIVSTCPEAIRLLVSEQADRATVLQSVGVAHQFIPASWDPEDLKATLDRSLRLRRMLSNDELRARVGGITSLPSPPEIYDRIVAELQSDDPSIQKIAELIGKDVGITAKLLQMVNSAYFGLRNRVDSVLHAASLVGLDTIQSIAFSTGVFGQFADPGVPGFTVDSVYSRCQEVGARARLIAHAFDMGRKDMGDALMGGMLHDVGKLLMLGHFKDEFLKALELAKSKGQPLHVAEREVIGVSDSEMGAYLLSLWGLPDSILETVALYGTPSDTAAPKLNALTAVHLAYAVHYDEAHHVRDEAASAVDAKYVKALGISDQIPSLRTFCTGAVV